MIDRDEDTLFELLVEDDKQAAALFTKIKAIRPVAEVTCHSLDEYLNVEEKLASLGDTTDIFLYLTMPKAHINWDLIESAGTGPLEDVLFRLWPKGHRLYFVRKGGANSLLGGSLVARNEELGLEIRQNQTGQAPPQARQ